MDQDGTLPRHHRWILLLTLVAVYFVYVASSVGANMSNDGSHYALVYTMVERGSFRVDDLHWPTEDVATDRFPIPVPEQGPADSGPGQIPRLEGEHFYSNKPPGTAVLAIPFYCLGRVLDPWMKRYPPPATGPGQGRFPHDWLRMEVPFFAEAKAVGYPGTLADLRRSYLDEWQRQNCVNLLPALLGVLCTWLVYRLCRHLGTGFWPALVTAVLVAVGTIQWRYATVLFSHMATTALLLLLIDGLACGWAWRRSGLWGLAVGWLIATQYQAALFVPFLAGYWWWRGREVGQERWGGAARIAAGAAIPLALLAAYQWACFGHPLVNPVSRSRYFPYAGSAREMLSGSPTDAAVRLFIYEREAPEISQAAIDDPRVGPAGMRPVRFVQFPLLSEPTGWRVTESLRRWLIERLGGKEPLRPRTGRMQGAGLFLVSPFLVVALLGWLLFGFRASRPAGLVALLLVAHVTFIAFVRAPTGGGTYDARYLTSVIPLWAAGFAFTVERIAQSKGSSDPLTRVSWAFVRWVFYTALGLLGSLSVTNMLHSMAVFGRHDSGLGVQDRLWLDWNTRLAACFQSAGNWPLLIVAAGVAAVVAGTVVAVRHALNR